MKNINSKSVQIFGFMRIAAFVVTAILIIFATVKAVALAPHCPDIALQAKVDMHREATEKKNNAKASKKVDAHKEYKDRKKAEKQDKKPDVHNKKPKEKKPPKPTKQDKKNAAKDKARNLH